MKKMKIVAALTLSVAMALSLCACGQSAAPATSEAEATTEAAVENAAETTEAVAETAGDEADVVEYTVGLCNYVDDASLNQICDNIQNRLSEIGAAENVKFTVKYQNCNADANVLTQIVDNFIADQVDLMIGVATPVAMTMKSEAEGTGIPVVFAAVSDPLGAGLVADMENANSIITGTSDYLDTEAIMNLIFANDPDASTIGLLYDLGQDASTTAINDAKNYLDAKGVAYKEYTGTTVDEVSLAVQSMIADGVSAVFTPSDNTIMTAELSIYESLAEAGIPHYAGADSFALNGAFVGYGVDYANLGVETANMVWDIVSTYSGDYTQMSVPVKTFDNGIATVNTETCSVLGYDLGTVKAAFEPFCTQVAEITTAESFE